MTALAIDAPSAVVAPPDRRQSWRVPATLFVGIAFAAAPGRRMAAHDDFEFTHRFGGWAALLIGCVTTVLFVASQRGSEGLISALLRAPTVWITALRQVQNPNRAGLDIVSATPHSRPSASR